MAQIKDNGEVAYYHCDQIGIPRELTDQQGNLLWHASYKGWGELQGEHNLKGVHQPLRLQNQYFDKETGLHYNFFRYYEPTVGRFTTQDPIGLAGGENLYRFESTVQNQIDPLGLFAMAIPWVISGLEYVVSAVAGLMIGAAIVESTKDNSKEKAQSKLGNCDKPKCPDDVYKKLNKDVHDAKSKVRMLGGCKPNMNKYEQKIRASAWKQLALARSIREQTCWEGGDTTHQ